MNPNAREFVPKGGPVLQVAQLAPNPPFASPQPQVNPLVYSNLLTTYNTLKTGHEILSKNYTDLYDDYNNIRKDYDYLNDDHKELLSAHAILQDKYKALKNVQTLLNEEDSLQCSIMEELRNENKGLHESYKRIEATLKKEKKEVQRLKNELDTHAKLRETSVYTITALETANAHLEEELAALREEIQKLKEENESSAIQNDLTNSEMKEYKEKFEKLQTELGTHVLNFIKTIDNVSKEKDEAVQNMELYKHQYHEKSGQVRSMMEILNKAAMEFKQDHTSWEHERKALQDSIESLCYTYAEKSEESAYYKSVVDGYEQRILELQAYKGITSTLYIPPSAPSSPPYPTKPIRRQIMNPEEEDEEEQDVEMERYPGFTMLSSNESHDIWS
jgi:chromosome segregation ATPase